MGKFVHSPLKVVCDENKTPARVWWNNSLFEVKVLERWKDTGCWWRGEGEKDFFRLDTSDQLWEVYFDSGNGRWWMYKIYD